jgi:DNA invertase Pin-like site-specific DNA recombinase
MNLVGYVRVSSEGQADGYGPDVQEQAIRAWCKTHDHRLVTITSDVGVSGTKPADERPGLSEALDMLRPPPMAVEKRRAAGLVIARLDRLARELTVQEAILGLVWRDGGSVFTADYGEVLADDPDDPMRTALRQVAGVFAQLDRALIAKRLRDGRRAKAATGRKAVGDYAYGYQGGGTGRTRDAVANPTEQAAVARIVELRREGNSYRAIVAVLDAEGHRPRRADRWSPMTVRSVVLRTMSETRGKASAS